MIMKKNDLKKNEFAINHRAKIEIISKSLKFQPDDSNIMTLTITCKLKDKRDLEIGPKPIISFDQCGVFDTTTSDGFKDGQIKDLTLFVDTSDNVILQSNKADANFITKGIKGEHGDTLALKK